MRPPVSTSPPVRLLEDPLSGRAVFVAPSRAGRPHGGAAEGCPFCAGREHLTPHEVLRIPADPALPWDARIIPNKYPFAVDAGVVADGDSVPEGGGRPAHGVHEVIIESPRHETSVRSLDAAVWRASWRLSHRRLGVLAAREDLAWGMVFKNSGAAAGASLDHVHSQLVALAFVPPLVAEELAAVAADAADPFARLIEDAEREDRLVASRGGLVALVPPAPRQPLETWIVPRRRVARFHEADDADVDALADLTRHMAARIEATLPGSAYNWWLHQAPFASRPSPPAAWRWHLEIVPRITSLAGFELGTGCHVSIATAADSARALRG